MKALTNYVFLRFTISGQSNHYHLEVLGNILSLLVVFSFSELDKTEHITRLFWLPRQFIRKFYDSRNWSRDHLQTGLPLWVCKLPSKRSAVSIEMGLLIPRVSKQPGSIYH